MATRSKTGVTKPLDYAQLNALSSVVMYDTTMKKRKGKFYKVQKIIETARNSKGLFTVKLNFVSGYAIFLYVSKTVIS